MAASDAPRGLFVDLDGTLADSLHVMRDAYRAFLGRHGLPGSDAEFEGLNGPPLPEVVRTLRARHRLPGEFPALLAAYEGLVDAAYEAVIPARGAAFLLERARAIGWVCGVVTSNRRERARAWLERAGLGLHISFLVAGEEAGRGKPFPDPYLAALRQCGGGAARCLAVEDSAQGAAAARAAGLPTVGLHAPGAAPQRWPEGVVLVDGLPAVVPMLEA